MSLVKTEIQRRRRKPKSSSHTIVGGNASFSNPNVSEPNDRNATGINSRGNNVHLMTGDGELNADDSNGINSRGNNVDLMTGDGEPSADDSNATGINSRGNNVNLMTGYGEPSADDSNATVINSRGNNVHLMTGDGEPSADDLGDYPKTSSYSPPSAIVEAAVAAAANPSIIWKE